jgi:succinyl-CoA synthetase beta subunit
MLRLFEHEAKALFSKYGIPTPAGGLATSPAKVREIATALKFPVVIKAQVLVGGRGKAGGILFADSPSEAEQAARKLLDRKIQGIAVT